MQTIGQNEDKVNGTEDDGDMRSDGEEHDVVGDLAEI